MKLNAIIVHVLGLASKELDLAEVEILKQLLSQMFIELDKGNSCLVIENLANTLLGAVSQIIDVLNKSGLIYVYQFDNVILEKPLTLIKTKTQSGNSKILHLLYITRYFYYELKVALLTNQLHVHSQIDKEITAKYFRQLVALAKDGFPNQEQLQAISSAIENKLSIITGGPGTGKTTTVVLLLWLFYNIYSTSDLKVAICAPTGKAVSRVHESIMKGVDNFTGKLNFPADLLQQINFATLHKLLGFKRNNIYFNNNENNPLDLDVLIIDESSMISLPLFYKLLLAIDEKKIKHIVFLGDKNQLSSVEEGYVFASLIKHYTNTPDLFSPLVVTQLIHGKRSGTNINRLATNILAGKSEVVIQDLLQHNQLLANNLPQFLLDFIPLPNRVQENTTPINLLNYLTYLANARSYDDIDQLFRYFRQTAVLCLINSGSLGVDNLNLQIERLVKLRLSVNNTWYSGRPIIILANDYSLGLNNGDIGICLMINNSPIIVFDDGRKFIPEVLPKYNLAYAITIHKSQGSEFDNVVIILPSEDRLGHGSELLSRELLYTAVTRAKQNIILYARVNSVTYAIENYTIRNSGLEHLL